MAAALPPPTISSTCIAAWSSSTIRSSRRSRRKRPRRTTGSRPAFVVRYTPSDHGILMAQQSSFDVTTGVDMQEVDNAINQAQKEIAQRYDFKGSNASIEFKRAEELISLVADSDFQMRALFDVLQSKLIKRGVPVKNLDVGDIKQAGGDT